MTTINIHNVRAISIEPAPASLETSGQFWRTIMIETHIGEVYEINLYSRDKDSLLVSELDHTRKAALSSLTSLRHAIKDLIETPGSWEALDHLNAVLEKMEEE